MPQRVKRLFAQVRVRGASPRADAALITRPPEAFEVKPPATSRVDTDTILIFQELIQELLASRNGVNRVLAFRYKGACAELTGALLLMFHAPEVEGVALAAALPVSTPKTERRFLQAVRQGEEFRPFKQRVQTEKSLKLLQKALRKALKGEISVCVLLGRAKRGFWPQAATGLNVLPGPTQVPVKLRAYLANGGAGLTVAGRRTERIDYAHSSFVRAAPRSQGPAGESLFAGTARTLLRDPRALLWSLAAELERAERIEVLCHARIEKVLVLLHFAERSVQAAISVHVSALSGAQRSQVFADVLHMLDYRHIGRQSPGLLDSEGEFKRVPSRKMIAQLQAAVALCD